MFDKVKKAAPLTAVVAAVLSVTSFPLPFDVSHTLAAWVAVGALAVHLGGIFTEKPTA